MEPAGKQEIPMARLDHDMMFSEHEARACALAGRAAAGHDVGVTDICRQCYEEITGDLGRCQFASWGPEDGKEGCEAQAIATDVDTREARCAAHLADLDQTDGGNRYPPKPIARRLATGIIHLAFSELELRYAYGDR